MSAVPMASASPMGSKPRKAITTAKCSGWSNCCCPGKQSQQLSAPGGRTAAACGPSNPADLPWRWQEETSTHKKARPLPDLKQGSTEFLSCSAAPESGRTPCASPPSLSTAVAGMHMSTTMELTTVQTWKDKRLTGKDIHPSASSRYYR